MATLSSSAWIAHDLGLATAIGGTLFGRQAFQPSLRELDNRDRAVVSDVAWRRFSWINLAAHGVMAATWAVGRTMLTGSEVSDRSRSLTRVKDMLVIGSLATGIASVLLGRKLGTRMRDSAEMQSKGRNEAGRGLQRVVGVLGITNLALNAGIGAVTTALAMEASHSLRFSVRSRRLP